MGSGLGLGLGSIPNPNPNANADPVLGDWRSAGVSLARRGQKATTGAAKPVSLRSFQISDLRLSAYSSAAWGGRVRVRGWVRNRAWVGWNRVRVWVRGKG